MWEWGGQGLLRRVLARCEGCILTQAGSRSTESEEPRKSLGSHHLQHGPQHNLLWIFVSGLKWLTLFVPPRGRGEEELGEGRF